MISEQEALDARRKLEEEIMAEWTDHHRGKRSDCRNPFNDRDYQALTTICNHYASMGPDWSNELPKEATQHENDYPITDTKIAAVLQRRRVLKPGGWNVTLQSRQEWREYHAERIAALRDWIERAESGDYDRGLEALESIVKDEEHFSAEAREKTQRALEALAVLRQHESKYQLDAAKAELADLIAGGSDA